MPQSSVIISGNGLPSSQNEADEFFNVDESRCLVHLKLLYAISAMKRQVRVNGAWTGISDDLLVLDASDMIEEPSTEEYLLQEQAKTKKLGKLREKRWALFVARAVDRYEAWWNSQEIEMLKESDMRPGSENPDRYMDFPSTGQKLEWKTLPPLDVLMVMHAHMLNSRAFLEDTMRCGLRSFWAAGMPWELIDNAISPSLNYTVSEDGKSAWKAQTGRVWHSKDEFSTKLKCPYCSKVNRVLWTTCGKLDCRGSYQTPDLIGEGYGDDEFRLWCPYCRSQSGKEALSVSKFINDTRLLLEQSVPMPGTILEPQTGQPQSEKSPGDNVPRSFPNRMIRKKLGNRIQELREVNCYGEYSHPAPTVDKIEKLIKDIVTDSQAVRRIDDAVDTEPHEMHKDAQAATWKMMSCYRENGSPFAVNLRGAVMRQGVFINKMAGLESHDVEFIKNPVVKEYRRFLSIMEGNPDMMPVPTLGVDLAWYTHQLEPQSYYQHTVRRMGIFIDHGGKIDGGDIYDSISPQ